MGVFEGFDVKSTFVNYKDMFFNQRNIGLYFLF